VAIFFSKVGKNLWQLPTFLSTGKALSLFSKIFRRNEVQTFGGMAGGSMPFFLLEPGGILQAIQGFQEARMVKYLAESQQKKHRKQQQHHRAKTVFLLKMLENERFRIYLWKYVTL